MKAAVYDKKSGKPIMVVQEQDGQVVPVEGDAELFKKLKMDKGSLKELAEYLEGSEALTLRPIEEKEEEEEHPSRDETVSSAVKVLKKLLITAKERQKKNKEDKEEREKAVYAKQDAEVVGPEGGHVYVSLDGDHIGNAIMRAEEANDEETLKDVSRRIDSGQDYMKQWAEEMGGEVIEAGGDEGLLKMPKSALDHISDLRRQYHKLVGATATVGVGESIRDSTKARMLGKLRGRNRVVIWEGDEMERELEHRVNAEDQDCKDRLKVLMQRCEPEEAEKARKESEQLAPEDETKKSQLAGLPDLEEPMVFDLSKAEPVGQPSKKKVKEIPRWVVEEAESQGLDPKFYSALLRTLER
jgi:hypothetical protein